MGRVILTSILISTFLVCPIRCTSPIAFASASAEAKEAPGRTCSCCSHKEVTTAATGESPSPQSPQDLPVGDCTCANCVCEGAMLEDGFKFRGLLEQSACLDVCTSRSEFYLGALSSALRFEIAADGCSICGGIARAAQQSWVI